MPDRATLRYQTTGGEASDIADARTDGRLLAAIDRTLGANRSILSFEPELEDRFEADTRVQRIRHMRRTILLGLLVFHIYNVAGFVTTPDLALLNVALRVGAMTPVAILIIWAVGGVGAQAREAIAGLGMLAATAIPVLIFWLGTGPLLPLTTATIWLSVVFANITLPLRFPWACFVSGTTALAVFGGLYAKDQISAAVSGVLGLDMVTGMLFSLVATHRIESANRRDYLLNLRETLRGKQLVADNTTLARLSTTDSLTGLSNRLAFTRRLSTLWEQSLVGRPFSVILIDVDHFKRFNDRYGHGAGDTCLREVATILETVAVGAGALVARYGGEEFGVLLADRDLPSALAFAERLRRGIDDHALVHGNREDGPDNITVSVGVAASTGGATSAAALVEAADVALYQAKSRGRNQTCPGHEGEAAPTEANDFADWRGPGHRPVPVSA